MITKEMIYQKTPQQLTALLYEAGIAQFEKAEELLAQKKYTEANRSMQKINEIMERLGAGLNYEAGIVSDQLDALYNYIADTVIEANIQKDAAKLTSAKILLQTLADSWNEALKTAPAKPVMKRKQQAYEQSVFIEEQTLTRTIEVGK